MSVPDSLWLSYEKSSSSVDEQELRLSFLGDALRTVGVNNEMLLCLVWVLMSLDAASSDSVRRRRLVPSSLVVESPLETPEDNSLLYLQSDNAQPESLLLMFRFLRILFFGFLLESNTGVTILSGFVFSSLLSSQKTLSSSK